MQFKDLKDGYSIYIFNRNTIDIKTGRVTNVSSPHASTKPGGSLNFGLVVDVIVSVEGKNYSYEVKDCSESAYIDTTLITSNIDIVVNEIKALKNQSEDIIKSVPRHEEIASKCTSLLAEFDPVYREKKETDDKINSLTNTVSELAKLVEKLNDKIK